MEKDNIVLPCGFRDPWALAGLPVDTPLAVAFSGGADSVALLAMLAAHEHVVAVHVHHGLRGAEADRDAAFCRETAAALGVPITVLYVDVPALCAESGESIETAARTARYRALAAFMEREGIPLLVTAHHADDQLETVLQNLLRGAGTRGLSGIPAKRPLGKGVVVRPLLFVPRTELLDYLNARGLSFVTDSSNEELFCRRNRLRANVLPLLYELQPRAAEHAAQSAAALSEDEVYFAALAEEFLRNEGNTPRVSELAALPRPVRTRVWRQILPVRPEAKHIAALEALIAASVPHRSLSLPHCRVRLENGRVTVGETRVGGDTAYEVDLTEGENPIPTADGVVIVSRTAENGQTHLTNVYKYTTCLSLSSAMIKGNLRMRSRRAGDRILAGGMHKEVRKLAAWRPFPLDVRAYAPLLTDDAGLLALSCGTVRDGCRGNDLFVFFYFN